MTDEDEDERPEARVSTERIILAISRGSGRSVRQAATELGVSTTLVYKRLGRLCEDAAQQATERRYGPCPAPDDPRQWNAWHRARYQALVGWRKSFGLRSHGAWTLNGVLLPERV